MTRILPNGDLIDIKENRVWINGVDQGEMQSIQIKKLFQTSKDYKHE